MTLSAFAPVAFGAELTTEQKWQALVDAGIFDADGTGQGAQLDANMTRAQFTKVIVKLLGLQEVSDTPSFDDVKGHWAAGYIEAAKRAGLVDGVSDNPPLFAPDNEVTLEQLAKLVVEALDLEQSTDAVSGKVSDWAKGYVAAAVKAGLLPASSDYTVPAKREVLVTATYQAREIEEGKKVTKIESFKAVGAKKLEVKFSKAVDTSKAEITVKKGSNNVNIAKTTWSDDAKTVTLETTGKLTKGDYTVSVAKVENSVLEAKASVEDEKVAKLAFTSDKAPYDRAVTEDTYDDNDNDRILVTLKIYNQYGEDVTSTYAGEVTLTASKGTIGYKDASKGLIQIETTVGYNLNETVYVSAVHPKSGTFVSQVFTVALKSAVADINIVKLVAKDNKTLTVSSTASDFWFEVEAKDQYGNAVAADDIGKDVIVSVSNPSAVSFKTKTWNNQTIADFDEKDGKVILELARPKNNRQEEQPFGKGTHTIYMISKSTGKQSSLTFEIADDVYVDTLTLSAPDSVAVKGEKIEIPFTAVDQFGKEIQKAADLMNGMQVLSVSGPVTSSFTDNVQNRKIYFEQDYDRAKLILDASDAARPDQSETVYITAVTKSGKSTQLSFTLNAEKKPQTVIGVDEVKQAIALGGSTDIKYDKIKIEDQYGRIKKLSDFSGYKVRVTVSDRTKVSITGGTDGSDNSQYIDVTNNNATLNAVAQGSVDVSLKLYNSSDEEVTGSEYKFTVKAVKLSEIADVKVGDIGKIYTGGSEYGKAVSVTGLLSDGTEVALPSKGYYDANGNNERDAGDDLYFTIVESVYGLSVTPDSKLVADEENTEWTTTQPDVWGIEDGKEKTFVVTIQAFTKDSPKVFHKEVVVSRANPAPEKIELTDGTYVKKTSDNSVKVSKNDLNYFENDVLLLVFDAVKLTDQYGVEFENGRTTDKAVVPNEADFISANTVYASNFSDSSRNSLSTVIAGDSFYVTAITSNNKSITFKVVVTD